MCNLARNPNVRAVGECGLDYFRNLSLPSVQKICFEAHLALAEELNKPLFLHQRDAYKDFIEILDNHSPNVPIIVHCFTDGLENSGFFRKGYYIGITGWIADKRRNQGLLKPSPICH